MEEDLKIDNNEQSIDNVYINEHDKLLLSNKCPNIKNLNLRSRIFVNYLSAFGAKKILSNYGIECDDSLGLQNIQSIISRWDIAEVFVGDCRISVRANFDDYKLFIPKKHKRYGVIGDVFMFVRLEDDCIKLLGFLNSNYLDNANSDNDNYYLNINDLKSFDNINFNLKKEKEDVEQIKIERKKIIQYLENNLDDKISFFKLLANSNYLREEMIKFEKSQRIYSELFVKENEIKNEKQKDINNISRLADAFIQSTKTISNISDSKVDKNAEDFKIECTRANLEKLFNLDTSNNLQDKDIHNQTNDEVMDKLLSKSEIIIQDDRLPMVAVLKAFRFFVFLLLLIFLTSGLFCYYNYDQLIGINSTTKFKQNITEWLLNVKKK